MAAPKGNKNAKGSKTNGRKRKITEKNREKIAEAMLDFFEDRYQTFVEDVRAWKTKYITIEVNGEEREVTRKTNEPLVDVPFYADFAKEIGISYRTLKQCEDDGDVVFSQTWQKCKEIQGRYIALATMNGLSHPSFSIFFASNLTDWRNKNQLSGPDDGPIKHTITEMDDEQLAKIAGIATTS